LKLEDPSTLSVLEIAIFVKEPVGPVIPDVELIKVKEPVGPVIPPCACISLLNVFVPVHTLLDESRRLDPVYVASAYPFVIN
jgi:hypothetical protein